MKRTIATYKSSSNIHVNSCVRVCLYLGEYMHTQQAEEMFYIHMYIFKYLHIYTYV